MAPTTRRAGVVSQTATGSLRSLDASGTCWRPSSWAGWPCWATFDAWSRRSYLIASRNLQQNENSQIFLVPFVAVAMIFVRRARFRYCKPTGTALGFAIAGLGWCLHIFGFYQNIMALWHLGAVLVLIGCVLSVFGKHALFRFFPAVAVLVFLIPVPGMIRLRIAAPLENVDRPDRRTAS